MERRGEGTSFTLDRKLFSSDIWKGPPLKLKLWIYLIGNANYYDSGWKDIPIPRGCMIRGERRIAMECEIAKSTVRRYLLELQNEDRIKLTSLDRLGTFIEVKKYNQLQQDAKAVLGMMNHSSSYILYNNTKLYILDQARLEMDRLGENGLLAFAKKHDLTENEINQVRGTRGKTLQT